MKSTRQKGHRRSNWACDECRLRKRKCGGSQPCEPCKASNLECDYRFRRPTLTPTQRIRLLEQHLRHATSSIRELKRHMLPGGRSQVKSVLDVLDSWSYEPAEPASPTPPNENDQRQPPRLSNMLAGSHRLISPAPWTSTFYGPLSEVSFILRTLELFDPAAASRHQSLGHVMEIFSLALPADIPESRLDESLTAGEDVRRCDLPTKARSLEVIGAFFARFHVFTDFLHEQQFRTMVDILYDHDDSNEYAITRFRPLLHHVIAIGWLFNKAQHRILGCSVAVGEAVRHFMIGQKLLQITQCSDLIGLQSLLCGVVFLLQTSRMSLAHGLIGLAYSSAMRLGLHCKTLGNPHMTADERRARVLLFAALVKVDLYASLILDLPRFIQDDLVDMSVINFYEALDEEPELGVHVEVSVKHLELLSFTCKARQAVFMDPATGQSRETIDPVRLQRAVQDLQQWTKDVSGILVGSKDCKESTIIRYQVEMACNFSHLVLFRPFLHYLRVMADGQAISLAESRHALACIKVASTTVLRSAEMTSRCPELALSWEFVYTLFLAIMCLIFLISAHHGTSQPSEAWRRAAVGIETMMANACVDDGASSCLKVVKEVVRQLNHTVDFDFEQIEVRTDKVCGWSGSRFSLRPLQMNSEPMTARATGQPRPVLATVEGMISRSSSPPAGAPIADADEVLANAEDLALGVDFGDLIDMDLADVSD